MVIDVYLLLETGTMVNSLEIRPLKAFCYGSVGSELELVTISPVCRGISVDSFMNRTQPMMVCEEVTRVKIQRESRIHYLVDLYLKVGIGSAVLVILCAIICNFRAKIRSLNDVAFSIEFEETSQVSSNYEGESSEPLSDVKEVELE
jgi:hypothetical protein